MDAVSDKIALIFAGNEPFEILASANSVTPVRRHPRACFAAFKNHPACRQICIKTL